MIEARPPLTYRIEPRKVAVASEEIRGRPLVLCLHGWGMDAAWFARLLHGAMDLPATFLLPDAPHPVTRSDGPRGFSWYDYDGDAARFIEELTRLETMLLAFLTEVERNEGLAPPARALVGFSQGGYGGAYVALRNPALFRGVAVSGARIKHEALGPALSMAAAHGMEVLACHGRRDPHVQAERARASIDALQRAGLSVQWEEFDAGHSLGRTQVATIRAWLARVLGV